MIDKDKAKDAVNEGFLDGVKNLYRVLDAAIVERSDRNADEAFRNGLSALVKARDRAMAVIDTF